MHDLRERVLTLCGYLFAQGGLTGGAICEALKIAYPSRESQALREVLDALTAEGALLRGTSRTTGQAKWVAPDRYTAPEIYEARGFHLVRDNQEKEKQP